MSRGGREIPRRWLAALLGVAALALAACNGTAVVTLTSSASQPNFLAYRVSLVSVVLEQSGAKSTLSVLPASTVVDLSTLANLSEVLGAAAVAKGSYTNAVVTLDYSAAQIVYDDGSTDGVALRPVDANGDGITQVKVAIDLDPSGSFSIATRTSAQLALSFDLAASSKVDLAAKTVTVTPVLAASAQPIDSKQVRIRGPFVGVSGSAAATTGGGGFSMRITPFNALSGTGSLSILTGETTNYEIDGNVAAGSTGLSQLAGERAGTLTVAYGTLTQADQATTTTADGVTTTTSSGIIAGTAGASDVTFTATQVLAGASVQGAGRDRISGVVSARSGNVFALQDATLVAADGTETFLPGTAVISMGSGTLVTSLGQSATEFGTTQEISVGSAVDAFGILGALSTTDASMDVSAGRVRVNSSTASGLVTGAGTGIVDLDLRYLGGRLVSGLDFLGSGVAPNAYEVDTGDLDLSNVVSTGPVEVTGVASAFGVSPPAFIASSLLDPGTLQAELVVDWGAGTGAPFKSLDSTRIDLDVHNAAIGTRHQIGIGAQTIDLAGMSADPLIEPDPTAVTLLYSIGHAASATVESFNTYAAFAARLESELAGAKALALTAAGTYANGTLTATAITVLLGN